MRYQKGSVALAASAMLALAGLARAGGYSVTNLISDDTSLIPAQLQDPNLVNPWGIAFKGTSPIWLSDNNAGTASSYSIGASGPTAGTFIGIPAPDGTPGGTPTGAVGNPTTTGFQVGGKASAFIFDTEDGTVAAWSPPAGTATLMVNNSAGGAVYKGLAVATSGVNTQLYASNFNSGNVDVFNSSFQPVNLGTGAFSDPNNPLPPTPGHPGFAPFGIQTIGSNVYVTYALQDSAQHDDVAGAGNGFVDVFNTAGILQQRLITGGALNSPWGLAVAPASFGEFGGDLLVGNFGNSRINAFDPASGVFLGTLDDSAGNPVLLSDATDVKGLWGISFGNGAKGFDANTLYFTSGALDESHGLFGSVSVPEPASASILLLGGVGLLGRRRRGTSR